ncbi:MAG: phospholipase A [Pseudomonadota bacterium]
MNRIFFIGAALALSALTPKLFASSMDPVGTMDECLSQQLRDAAADTTVGEIRERCRRLKKAEESNNIISQRIAREQEAKWNPYLITAYKPNYILPVTYAKNLNDDAWRQVTGDDDPLKNYEAKLQLSLKIPLNYNDIMVENDALYFGFTLQAYWQVYNDTFSSPFRETNYQPELFYLAPLKYEIFGGETGIGVGVEHQSNGRGGAISRSWNRVYANFLWADEKLAMSLRPWYRIPEDDDDDDNPDIDDFMGHFEYTVAYHFDQMTLSGMARRNFKEGKGAFQAGLSFPIYGRLRGYVQYFNGYGESLIDYDRDVERIGVGILLTDFL